MTVTGLRPIDRLTLWWLGKREADKRPQHTLDCAECGAPVGPDEGAWFPQWGLAACSDDCSFLVQANHF